LGPRTETANNARKSQLPPCSHFQMPIAMATANKTRLNAEIRIILTFLVVPSGRYDAIPASERKPIAVSVLQAEAVILRTWPVHEADQIVSLFTRTAGRIRGVAKAAAKSRRRFGGALEPMTWVSASYAENPKQELVRLDSCEVITSPLSDPVDYARAAALAFYAEVLEEALPDHDPHEAVFRLVLVVLEHTRDGRVWMPVTYFALWVTRLLGWMPGLTQCAICGEPFGQEGAWFELQADGLVCGRHKKPASRKLTGESLAQARRIFQSPIASLAGEEWPASRGADLRRFAVQALERHLERRLNAAGTLTKLGG